MNRAIITISTGGYAKEAIRLFESIRENGGEAKDIPIILYTDKDIDVPPGVQLIKIHLDPRRGSNRFFHRTIKAHIYSNLPVDKAIFIDSDVECWGDFSELFVYCQPDRQFGIPDGRTPEPINMITSMVFRRVPFEKSYELAREVFGDEWFDAKDKPTAWNVGILPISKEVGAQVGPIMLKIFDYIEEWPEAKFSTYTDNFDEQIPLNFALWRLGIPTGNLPFKFNTTKMIAANLIVDPKEVVFLHLRHKHDPRNKAIYNEFSSRR